MKIIIVQMSPPRTASTLLYNAVCGLICPEQPILWVEKVSDLPAHLAPVAVIKTHLLELDAWRRAISNDRKVYFVSSERKDINQRLDPECANAPDNLVFQYEHLLETKNYTLQAIVSHIEKKLSAFLPDQITLDRHSCLERLIAMNEKVKELENESFKVWDKFYGVHGGHRNRSAKSVKKPT
jgi:hypothetical protein